ncbi:MAG: T9SS type A sorting domain-containing protein [Chitinophagales bacterium]
MKHFFTLIFILVIHLNFHFSSFSYTLLPNDITINMKKISDNKVNSIISPNPAADKAFLTFDNPNGAIYKIEIYDIIGNQVKEYNAVSTNKLELDVTDFDEGMYFYFIIEGEQQMSTGRLFVK